MGFSYALSFVPLRKARKDVNRVGNWYFMWCIFQDGASEQWTFENHVSAALVNEVLAALFVMKHEPFLKKVGTLCKWAVNWAVNRIPWAAEAVKLIRQKETSYIITGYISYERYYNILKQLIFKVWISANFKTPAAPRKKITRAEIRWFRVLVSSSLYYHDFHNCHH